MGIEESEQKMKHEWSLLDTILDLSEKIEEGVKFAESATTPIPEGKVVNIAYLLILITGERKKPVISGKKCRSARIPGRPSRTTSLNHTGAIISKRNPEPLPMDMELQKTMRRK